MTNLLKKAENIIKEIKEKHCCELAVIKNELTSSRGKPFFFSTVKVRQISDVYNLSVLLFIHNWVNLNTFIELNALSLVLNLPVLAHEQNIEASNAS